LTADVWVGTPSAGTMGPLTKSDWGGEVCQMARKGLRQIIRKATVNADSDVYTPYFSDDITDEGVKYSRSGGSIAKFVFKR
jgi:hypothetical protein